MKGNLKMMNIFKTWKSYDANLTENGIYFYEEVEVESAEQISHDIQNAQHVNFIPLRNGTVTIINQNQFRIQSEDINEILECDP